MTQMSLAVAKVKVSQIPLIRLRKYPIKTCFITFLVNIHNASSVLHNL